MSITGHCQLDTELLQPRGTRRWLGTLLPRSQPGPLDVGTVGDPQPAEVAGEGKGSARQGRDAVQQSSTFTGKQDTGLDFFLPNLLCEVTLCCLEHLL